MILGIGSDLANIERIEATIARFGDRFLNRVFTAVEQRKAESRKRAVAATYAKRWAAKEACSKALGTGLQPVYLDVVARCASSVGPSVAWSAGDGSSDGSV